MQERAFKNAKIEFIWNAVVDEVLGDEKVDGLRLRDVRTDERRDLPVSGFFVAIGHHPTPSWSPARSRPMPRGISSCGRTPSPTSPACSRRRRA